MAALIGDMQRPYKRRVQCAQSECSPKEQPRNALRRKVKKTPEHWIALRLASQSAGQKDSRILTSACVRDRVRRETGSLLTDRRKRNSSGDPGTRMFERLCG